MGALVDGVSSALDAAWEPAAALEDWLSASEISGASGASGAQEESDETEESAPSVAQSGAQDRVDSTPPPGTLGSTGIGVGIEGAAAAKDERAGASSGEAGEGVGVMGGSEVGTTGGAAADASPPVKEEPAKSGTSETRGAAAVAAGGS